LNEKEAAMTPLFELVIDPNPAERKDYDLHMRFDAPSISKAAYDLAVAFALKDVPDGETSTGHQRYRRLSQEEAIEQAFSLWERIISEMLKRGLAVEIPPYDEMRKEKRQSAGFVNSTDAA
jgi:hypothetical protein